MLGAPRPAELCTGIRWQKQDVFNRYTILTDKGPQRLTVPVEKPHAGAALAEVRISFREPWQQQHLRAITSAYRAAPYFEYFEQDLASLFAKPADKLVDFCLEALTFCLISLKNIPSTETPSYFRLAGEECWQKIDIITLRNQLAEPLPQILAYRQVFGKEFVTTTSVLDAIFCAGPRGLFIPPAGPLS